MRKLRRVTLAGSFGDPNTGGGMTAGQGAPSSGGKGYASSGTGWDMPAGSTIVGYTRRSHISQSMPGQPLMLPRWVAAAPAPPPPQNTTIFAPKISVPTNISTPVTTQFTAAVSPSMNVAAGSQGVQQGATTGQQATPTSANTVPQGTTTSPATGLTPDQVNQLLEQQRREQDALNAQRLELARKEAIYDAALSADKEREKDRAAYEARLLALQQPQQPGNIQPAQQAPVPLVTPPASTVPPVIKETAGKDAIITQAPKKQPWLLAALALGVAVVVMSDGKQISRARR